MTAEVTTIGQINGAGIMHLVTNGAAACGAGNITPGTTRPATRLPRPSALCPSCKPHLAAAFTLAEAMTAAGDRKYRITEVHGKYMITPPFGYPTDAPTCTSAWDAFVAVRCHSAKVRAARKAAAAEAKAAATAELRETGRCHECGKVLSHFDTQAASIPGIYCFNCG